MGPIRFGVLGCASIARRMMIPAVREIPEIELVAVASRDHERAREFAGQFGCTAEASYESLLARSDIDAVYIPLPPTLHELWVLAALSAGKHVLCEKPLTDSSASAIRMVAAARAAGRVLAENYMFLHHPQLAYIDRLIGEGNLGKLRSLRASFGFPFLPEGNIRHQAHLGGGARLDAGGYTLRIARHFFGDGLVVRGAQITFNPKLGVDDFGAVLLAAPEGGVAQLAFGFGCFYRCELQLWLSEACITAPRIFTAPPGFCPKIHVETKVGSETHSVAAANHFALTLGNFVRQVRAGDLDYSGLLTQARLLDEMTT